MGNKIVDHSDVVGASWTSNYFFIFDFTPGVNGLGKDSCKQDKKHLSFGIWCDLY